MFTLPWMVAREVFLGVRFRADFRRFRRLSRSAGADLRLPLAWSDRWPCLHDRTATCEFDRHYIYHTAWAARILRQNPPTVPHVDIASSLYFVGILSAFLPVDFYDYRPADLRLEGLSSKKGDLLALPFADASIESLSCLHVVEHIGLGRYGDIMDPDGDLKAMRELRRVLAPGGQLLLVVPVGRPRIQFNAHRIYSYRQIAEQFAELEPRQFALLPDRAVGGGLIINASAAQADAQRYGCGCFWFRKPRV